LTNKITTNVTSILCAKEEWKEENGARLLKEEVYKNKLNI